ncbi:MAG TPA: hypothetical protein VFQ72_04165 [Candidatus Paceibacterota bacterium]|nr:hypothetical protein [Candidatus Paceibacterota bacterium]
MNPFRYVLRAFAQIRREHDKGTANELCAVAAFDGPFADIPPWFMGIQNTDANGPDNRRGIDVILYTDACPVWIQIKSCTAKADAFRDEQAQGRRSVKIQVVVIEPHFSPERVRKVLLDASEPVYLRALSETAALKGAVFIPAAAALPS